jgi:hypothetical protein
MLTPRSFVLPNMPAPAPSTMPARTPDIAHLPLSFVPNAGQIDSAVRFQVRNSEGTLFFTPGAIVLSLPASLAPATQQKTIRTAQMRVPANSSPVE